MVTSLSLWLLAVPLLGLLLTVPLTERFARWVALGTSIVGAALALLAWIVFDNHAVGPQFTFHAPWIESLGVQFALGLDGLSLPLIILTKVITPLALCAGWGETRRPRAYFLCHLLLDFALTGTFLALDVVAFYIFFELTLIPTLWLVGVWGGEGRIRAALQLFLYTFGGSVALLAAVFWLLKAYGEQFGVPTAEIAALGRLTWNGQSLFLGMDAQTLVFLGCALAFLVKLPMLGLHGWLVDAYTEAPTSTTILLSAVLSKMGGYGLLRIAQPLAPDAFARFAPVLGAIAAAGILYGAWIAFRQTDMKRLLAYSSLSHVSFVLLGVAASTPEAKAGAIMQMVNHGLATGALFWLAGSLYLRRNTYQISAYGGLAKAMPWFATVFLLATAASLGVPGLNGFVGEFLVFFGSFPTLPWVTSVAVLGVVLTAVYLLTLYQKTFFGPVVSADNSGTKDLSCWEAVALAPTLALCVLLGVAPGLLLRPMKIAVSVPQTAKAALVAPAETLRVVRSSK